MANNWITWLMIFALFAMGLGISLLWDRYMAEKRRVHEMAVQFTDIAYGTGFMGLGVARASEFLAYLEQYGFSNPNNPHTWEYKIYDHDLNNLVNTAVDMSKGRANMDVGLAFMADMDKVLDRINPQNAPHHYGHPAEKDA